MISLETLSNWLIAPAEDEHLEFKEAKIQFDTDKLLRYCVALANEGGGHLILGVSDRPPRKVVSTNAFSALKDLNSIKAHIVSQLHIRVNVTELFHPDGRVLVFDIPSRPAGFPIDYNAVHFMRVGEEVRKMTHDQLRRVFAEGTLDWFSQAAHYDVSADGVIRLLDTQAFFDLMKIPYPTTQSGVLDRLSAEGLIVNTAQNWTITNLAAIVFAKKLDEFPLTISRKAVRVILYSGKNKIEMRNDVQGNRGYAVGFEHLVNFIHESAPNNRYVEETIRKEVKMFPRQAIRELVANALIHQDFLTSGASVMVEMYSDRLEVSNPGVPPIRVERFIDEYRSRNERLADLMRRLGFCEERGSGIDKVVTAAEVYQLPAPDFRVGETRTTAVLFAHIDFSEMGRDDKVRACYQHCCLQYVSSQRMSNQSLRKRFNLPETKLVTASQIISATKEAGLIKADFSESSSTRYARYVPFWA
ncbi:MAG: putative DNA binding domain-containing protein [Ignavibacteriae bacterium]|nr:putative DNA binding domain-containing protein [Ignavibacteriota bacterium]